jgi:hypothetical protein
MENFCWLLPIKIMIEFVPLVIAKENFNGIEKIKKE